MQKNNCIPRFPASLQYPQVAAAPRHARVMGSDGGGRGRARPDHPHRTSPTGDTITREEVERRCYNWAASEDGEPEGSKVEWPNAGWMDSCPCEDAFYAGTHIASCELTSSPAAAASGRGGSNPAPMPTRSGTGPSPSTTADSEAGIFMLVYASFAVASFLALVIVSWWWKREGQRRMRDEAIAAELANPWNVMARMRAGEHGGGGSRAGGNDGTNASNGTKHSSRSTVVRGSMWGMYFENPTGSVVFGKELAVLDDPDAVAYVYGEDADEEKGEKNKNDENDSRETPWEETRVTLDQHDPSDVAVRVYDGEDTRRHGARLAGAQLERLSSGTTSADLSSTSSSEMAGEGMDTERSGSFGSSRSLGSLTRGNDSSSDDNSRGRSSSGTSVSNRPYTLAALGVADPETYLPNSRQNSRPRRGGSTRLRSSQMWGDCDTDTDEETQG